MNVVKATRQFEAWLAQHTRVDQKDLRLKHSDMKKDVFMFFRATYYRWAQLWPQVCPDACQAPKVLAVGDLHVENFGTWRDLEGSQQKGCPFVLGERHQWLRRIAEGVLREPVHFWQKMDALPTLKTECPVSAIDAIEHLLP